MTSAAISLRMATLTPLWSPVLSLRLSAVTINFQGGCAKLTEENATQKINTKESFMAILLFCVHCLLTTNNHS